MAQYQQFLVSCLGITPAEIMKGFSIRPRNPEDVKSFTDEIFLRNNSSQLIEIQTSDNIFHLNPGEVDNEVSEGSRVDVNIQPFGFITTLEAGNLYNVTDTGVQKVTTKQCNVSNAQAFKRLRHLFY
ncbi:MAG: hypothetical protein Sylvanvirus10_18 [Sylvanvirus sp.]|uniref:Uncharacterized protein n=1 Tax=Sylvanvirus sp. TaxID=2487774 RepID=A0A3G5AJS2_9VIRU|nr:MAG: hypothetical protein Sylvanvirus10_18 [Sylvanvirus sp.]